MPTAARGHTTSFDLIAHNTMTEHLNCADWIHGEHRTMQNSYKRSEVLSTLSPRCCERGQVMFAASGAKSAWSELAESSLEPSHKRCRYGHGICLRWLQQRDRNCLPLTTTLLSIAPSFCWPSDASASFLRFGSSAARQALTHC